jgi:hypothetical protein
LEREWISGGRTFRCVEVVTTVDVIAVDVIEAVDNLRNLPYVESFKLGTLKVSWKFIKLELELSTTTVFVTTGGSGQLARRLDVTLILASLLQFQIDLGSSVRLLV